MHRGSAEELRGDASLQEPPSLLPDVEGAPLEMRRWGMRGGNPERGISRPGEPDDVDYLTKYHAGKMRPPDAAAAAID